MKSAVKSSFVLADPETLAIAALTYLAADAERLGGFLAVTGFSPADLRNAANSPAFVRGILSHMANDEQRLIDFAGHLDVRPEALGHAIARSTGQPDQE